MMNLRLSEDEFATLIDMVSLAAEISSLNQQAEAQDQFSNFEQLEDKLLKRAKENGYADIIEIDPENNKHRVTAEYQEQSYIQQCIDEMRNEIFWEELAVRLAERDVIKLIGQSEYEGLSHEERIAQLEPRQKQYWEQLSKTGIANLHLITPSHLG